MTIVNAFSLYHLGISINKFQLRFPALRLLPQPFATFTTEPLMKDNRSLSSSSALPNPEKDVAKGIAPVRMGPEQIGGTAKAEPDKSPYRTCFLIPINLTLRQYRYLLFSIFILLECIWLGFGLYVGQVTWTLRVPNDGQLRIFNHTIPFEQVSQSR